MKKYYTILIFLFIGLTTIKGQQPNQKMKLLKTSYITEQLNLTPAEAEKFWPVYNIYTNKIHALRFDIENGLIKNLLKKGNFDTISESDAKTYLENLNKLDQELVVQKQKLVQDLSKIISSKKIIKLQNAERDFNRRILQEYGKRRGMKNP